MPVYQMPALIGELSIVYSAAIQNPLVIAPPSAALTLATLVPVIIGQINLTPVQTALLLAADPPALGKTMPVPTGALIAFASAPQLVVSGTTTSITPSSGALQVLSDAPSTGAPNPPSVFYQGQIGSNWMILAWDVPAAGPVPTSYNVYKDGVSAPFLTGVTTDPAQNNRAWFEDNAPSVRWAPGHYWQFGENDSAASRISQIASLPASVVGVVDTWKWAQLEGAQGTYTFGNPNSVMAACLAAGKSYIFVCASRAFGGTPNPVGVVPTYVINNNWTYTRTSPSSAAGAALWIAGCMQAKTALEQAFAAQASTALVAIGGDETVFGASLTTTTAYSVSAYVANEIQRWQTLRAAAPAVAVTVYINELNGDDAGGDQTIALFTAAASLTGVFLNGGPDAFYQNYLTASATTGQLCMDGRDGAVNYSGSPGTYGILCGVQAAEASSTTFANVNTEFDHFAAAYRQWYEGSWSGSPGFNSGAPNPQLLSFLGSNPISSTFTKYPSTWPSIVAGSTHSYQLTSVLSGVESAKSAPVSVTFMAGPIQTPIPPVEPNTWIVPTPTTFAPIPGGTTWTVTNLATGDHAGTGTLGQTGCSFLHAIINYTPGDLIVLPSNTQCPISNFNNLGAGTLWPAKANPNGVWTNIITSDQYAGGAGALTPYSYNTQYGGGCDFNGIGGNWVLPSNPGLAILTFDNTNVGTGLTFNNLDHIRFVGVWFKPIAYNGYQCNNAVILTGCDYFSFDRCAVGNDSTLMGASTTPAAGINFSWLTRGIFADCKHLLVHQCYGYGFTNLTGNPQNGSPSIGGDSQFIALKGGQMGCVQNCFTEAVSENIFSGGVSIAQNNIPSDFVVRYCFNWKNPAWLINNMANGPKNHIETKCMQRCQIYGNINRYSYMALVQGQQGVSFGTGAVDQTPGNNPWNRSTDVDIFNNIVLDVGLAWQSYISPGIICGVNTRNRLRNNIFYHNPPVAANGLPQQTTPHQLQMSRVTDTIIDHNTFIVNGNNSSFTFFPNTADLSIGFYGTNAQLNNTRTYSGDLHPPWAPAGQVVVLDRVQVTNNLFVAATALTGSGLANDKFGNVFMGPAAPGGQTCIWDKNLSVGDAGASLIASGGTTYVESLFAALGMQNFQGPATGHAWFTPSGQINPPLSPADWNIVSGPYAAGGAKCGTDGKSLGATVSVFVPPSLATIAAAGYIIIAPQSRLTLEGITGQNAYNVDPTGNSDSTAGIQAAIDDGCLNFAPVYLPHQVGGAQGVYKTTDILRLYTFINENLTSVNLNSGHAFLGATNEKGQFPIIRLAANTAKFGSSIGGLEVPMMFMRSFGYSGATNPGDPTKWSAAYWASLNPWANPADQTSGLVWDTGSANVVDGLIQNVILDCNAQGGGNQWASGMAVNAAQTVHVANITVLATGAYAGVSFAPGNGSVMMNIAVIGGQYGVNLAKGDNGGVPWQMNCPTFAGLTCHGQTVACMAQASPTGGETIVLGFDFQPASGGVAITAPPSFFSNYQYNISLHNGQVIAQAPGSAPTAFPNLGGFNLYLEDVYVQGFANVTQFPGQSAQACVGVWTHVTEYCSTSQKNLLGNNPPINTGTGGGPFPNYNITVPNGGTTATFTQVPEPSIIITTNSASPPSDLVSRHVVIVPTIDNTPYVDIRSFGATQLTVPGQSSIAAERYVELIQWDSTVAESNAPPPCGVAINAAIAAAAAAPPGTGVLVPRGTWESDQTIALAADTLLFGVGRNRSQVLPHKTWTPSTLNTPLFSTPSNANATCCLVNLRPTKRVVIGSPYNAAPDTGWPGDKFIYLLWRSGGQCFTFGVYPNIQFSNPNGNGMVTPAGMFYSYFLGANAGGRFYGYCQGGTTAVGMACSTSSRPIFISGTQQPMYFYSMNTENAENNFNASCAFNIEIANSKNVRVYGVKREGHGNTMLIRGSDNIGFFGSDHLLLASNGPAVTELGAGNSNILLQMHHPYSDQPPPATQYLVKDDTSGAVLAVPKILSLFKMGALNDAAMHIVPLAPLAITNANLPEGQVGVPYSATLYAIGGSGSYVWSLVTPIAPNTLNWCALSPTGVLSGTPLEPETETIVAQVQDTVTLQTQQVTLPLGVNPAVTVATPVFNYASFSGANTLATSSVTASGNLVILGQQSGLSGAAISVLTGLAHSGGKAWYGNQVDIRAFTVDFTMTPPSNVPPPDSGSLIPGIIGINFSVQASNNLTDNSPTPTYGVQAGGDANMLGYGSQWLGNQGSPGFNDPIGNSVGIKFDMNNANQITSAWNTSISGDAPTSTGLYTCGGPSDGMTPFDDLRGSGFNFYTGHLHSCHLVYDGSLYTMVLKDTVTNAQVRMSWPINIPLIVGGNTAWVGFAGGKAGNNTGSSTWLINSFSFSQGYLQRLAAPTFSVLPGQYAGAQTVEINGPPGAAIFYTVNGRQPTTSSSVYSGPITVSANTFLQAVAVQSGFTDSVVASANYLIQASGSPTINFPSGFASASNLLSMVGDAVISGSDLQVMPQFTSPIPFAAGWIGCAWYVSRVNVASFSTTFTFALSSNAQQEGMTFCIQNQPLPTDYTFSNTTPPNALPDTVRRSAPGGILACGGGNGFGYTGNTSRGYISGLSPSVAIKFDAGNNTTGLYTNAADVQVNSGGTATGLNFTSGGHQFKVQLDYNNAVSPGNNLRVQITDLTSNAVSTNSYPVNIPNVVGGNAAYVGFTAGGFFPNLKRIINWTGF